MRNTKTVCTFLVTLILAVSAAGASHADEFGERFYAKAPAALGDFTAQPVEIDAVAQEEQTAKDLQNIMPAAGEEENDENAPEAPTDTAQ